MFANDSTASAILQLDWVVCLVIEIMFFVTIADPFHMHLYLYITQVIDLFDVN